MTIATVAARKTAVKAARMTQSAMTGRENVFP
jgi:hypothetical protein